jgi:hypothetical protein
MASLEKYSGTWSGHLAAHLLRRTTYGVSYETMKQFSKITLDECIQTLFQPLSPPPPPININSDDPDVPIGETWVDKNTSANVNGYRNSSLRGWSYELMLLGTPNIREKMTMFWHNHFVTADINDARLSYKYIELLRANVVGNFRQLTKDITIDPAMLNFLNGRDNTKQAPNENYARELMELFTLGKGDLAGPGDYTTYTEEDVKELAKALTGWNDVRNNLPIRSQFNNNRHDTTTKNLSPRFNSISIPNGGADEYKNIVDIIFQKAEVSLFIARKLYRWFVHSAIDAAIENDIIIPLAKIIKDDDYEMSRGIKTLLSSAHFFDACIIGGMIKNPIDFILSPLNQFKAVFPSDAALKQRVFFTLYATTNTLQMAMFQAPSVAGWAAFYQTPSYYRLWLNATSIPTRKLYCDAIASNGLNINTERLKLNQIATLDLFDDASDVDVVIREFSFILMSKPLAENQVTLLKSLLLGGTMADGWSKVYLAYKDDPVNETKKTAVINRIKAVVVYMMRMPEYQLS